LRLTFIAAFGKWFILNKIFDLSGKKQQKLQVRGLALCGSKSILFSGGVGGN